MCAVKTNMPKISFLKNRSKTIVQNAFYIWMLFSVCGGAVAFSNKPFRQWTTQQLNLSNVDDLQVL